MQQAEITEIDQFVINTVRQMREEKKLSQRDLAYEMDVSQSFIADVENPRFRAKYNLAHINTLAKIFECSPKDFLPEMPL